MDPDGKNPVAIWVEPSKSFTVPISCEGLPGSDTVTARSVNVTDSVPEFIRLKIIAVTPDAPGTWVESAGSVGWSIVIVPSVGVLVGVNVGVKVGVKVMVKVGVGVIVGVKVAVKVGVIVAVNVGVSVEVGVKAAILSWLPLMGSPETTTGLPGLVVSIPKIFELVIEFQK